MINELAKVVVFIATILLYDLESAAMEIHVRGKLVFKLTQAWKHKEGAIFIYKQSPPYNDVTPSCSTATHHMLSSL